MTYINQLHAIREMLSNSAPEIVQEGYESLFALWMENADSSDFIKDLTPIAIEYENTIREFENRLINLSTQDQITDTFLKRQLKSLATKVSNHRRDSRKNNEQPKIIQPEPIVPEIQETKDIIIYNEIPWGKLIWILIFSVIIVILILSSIYLLPRESIDCPITNGLEVGIDYPKYIAYGDTEEIKLTIKNVGDSEISGSLLIDFEGTKVHLEDEAKIKLETLAPSEQPTTKEIRFLLNELPKAGQYIYFSPVIMGNDTQCSSKEYFIRISPIPGLRKFVGLLWSTVGLTLVGMFWSQIKEWLFSVFKGKGG
jgi:hypothetical protein